jgi:hypothetical protein
MSAFLRHSVRTSTESESGPLGMERAVESINFNLPLDLEEHCVSLANENKAKLDETKQHPVSYPGWSYGCILKKRDLVSFYVNATTIHLLVRCD